ncbi:MAG: helicase [Desulfobacteraceae bacterium]|nr:helicase [Desulfobacteraceae bacterium]
MDYSKSRKKYIEWIKSQLMGPASGLDEYLNGISPIQRYPTGVLFPIVKGGDGIDPASENQSIHIEEDHGSEDETSERCKVIEPSQKTNRYMPPSSVGFSFFILGDEIEFQVQYFAVRYESGKERSDKGQYLSQNWKRIPLSSDDDHVGNYAIHEALKGNESKENLKFRDSILQGQAELDVLCRPFSGGWIVTVSLCNSSRVSMDGGAEEWNNAKNEMSLFEVGLVCTLDNGEVGVYPKVDPQLLSEEEQELELQYDHHHIYALGHGASVDWSLKNGKVNEIRSDFIPAVEVPQVTADVSGANDYLLSLEYLSMFKKDISKLADEMDKFVDEYGGWVEDQKKYAENLRSRETNAGSRIVLRMDQALMRMKKGVALLREDKNAAQAFSIANEAMLLQMAQSDKSTGKSRKTTFYKWRPFQLAFLLMVIESAVNEDCLERDIVDLIWFPTGGGKTEAYLGLVAFIIAWRRLTNPSSGGGTSVLMRYTLRLLTSQQYLRATRIICALELIRQKNSILGEEPITIGMWVGQASSPNTFKAAMEMVNKSSQSNGDPPGRLVLDACPWCRQAFNAPENYHAVQSKFYFRCTNPSCDFGRSQSGRIPCNVVDEALYADPPTFLIATIDKFARLAWEEQTNSFFGKNINRPPELIIQDELHLISGALGSVAGIYEAALDTVLIHQGIRPKHIASTATIRMAQEQVRRLYGKTVAVFPPPGLNCDDSFFAKTIPLKIRPGRMYLGYLAPSLNRQLCMAPLAAALLAAPEILFGKGQVDQEALLEAWWTLVIYHGSLKGVGNSHNLFNVDVGNYFRRLTQEAKTEQIMVNRTPRQVAQLTSVSTAEENARVFARLELSRQDDQCLDAALATNMISVGLDVARLALMIVNGQPLTTAEYIQASSRVGRSDVPGLVFTNYYRDQARSLSHYENFRPYHESFYRFVEPTSITPYTFQSRRRALHAALVIAVRHGCPHLLNKNQAALFDSDVPITRQVIETLKLRCAQADKERGPEIQRHIERLVQEWKSQADHCKSVKRDLHYSARQKINNANRLLHNHDDRIKGLWPTLQSMRNVENIALLKQL